MGFSCGIIGLPNSGKSTIFNALTALSVAAQPYPFCTIDPNVGIVPVPDERLAALAGLMHPEKLTPTTIEFIDIAGLVKDAHKGEGLGNRFLGQIREVDAVAHVVRCFEGNNVPHVYESIDPVRDIDTIETEIIVSDLEIVEERLDKMARLARVSKEKHEAEQEVLRRVKTFLDAGKFVDRSGFGAEELAILDSFALITSKPLCYIANIDEADLEKTPIGAIEKAANIRRTEERDDLEGKTAVDEIERTANIHRTEERDDLEEKTPVEMVAREAEKRGRQVVYICGKLEEELALLPEEERTGFMEMYNMKEKGIEKIIRAGYGILDLVTFYTVVGKEMRAWTIKKDTTAVKAAGKIHTDMERGFIKAEVIATAEFLKAGGEQGARERGVARIEGKEYVVQDGDILHIRFNV